MEPIPFFVFQFFWFMLAWSLIAYYVVMVVCHIACLITLLRSRGEAGRS